MAISTKNTAAYASNNEHNIFFKKTGENSDHSIGPWQNETVCSENAQEIPVKSNSEHRPLFLSRRK
jgi:hypothetical protein